MINFLQEYLRIDTSFPQLRYDDVITLFSRQAQKDGLRCEVVTLPSTYKALVLTAVGSDSSLPAIALSHHMDVVPAADKTTWRHDPFGGVIVDGLIYGRGTQDMKGVGVAHYFALKKIVDEHKKLKRTVHLILVPDEECGGYKGTGQLVEHPFFKDLNIGYILDEGVPSGDSTSLNIKVSERKPIQVLFTSNGHMAHGSRITINNAAHELISFLQHLVLFQKSQQLNVLSQPAGLLLSMNITSLQFGTVKNGVIVFNVVSDTATAGVDIRVPPTMRLADVHSFLQQLINSYPSISYTIKSTVQDRAYHESFRNDFYQSIEQAVQAKQLIPRSFHAEESSDLRFYLEKGIVGFGLTPFTCKENLHGVDEFITIKDLEVGRDVFFELIEIFCT